MPYISMPAAAAAASIATKTVTMSATTTQATTFCCLAIGSARMWDDDVNPNYAQPQAHLTGFISPPATLGSHSTHGATTNVGFHGTWRVQSSAA